MKVFIFFLFAFSFTISLVNIASGKVEITKRLPKLKSFPCMECHDKFEGNKIKLPVGKPHEKMEFKHYKEITSCFTCHNKKDRNLLRLINNDRVTFNESYKVCFQCHGEKKRDWINGTHGKQTGSWRGDKLKYSCMECHNAHHPAFPIMKADPGPVHPRGKKATHGGHHK